MTPADYARVKEIFDQAVDLPDAQRDAFVRLQCGEDTAVADEVISLLRFHRHSTILANDTVDQALQTSVASESSTDSKAPLAEPVAVDPPVQVDPYLVLGDVWEENRQILRRRLIVVAGVLAGFIAFSLIRLLLTDDRGAWDYAVRITGLAITAGCALILHRKPNLSLEQIRIAEAIVMANVCLLLIAIDIPLMLRSAAEQDATTLISINNWNYFVWTLVILVYGIFMPNTWGRAAAVVLPIVLIPSLIVLLANWLDPRIFILLAQDRFGRPLPTPLIAAGLAIYTAHLIHGTRLSAFQARKLAQYQLTKKIGEGGMGQVFEAEHLLLKRRCAIKLIRPEHCVDDRAMQRFEREVRATARLTHPHTIEVYDFGKTKDGVFFFAMELLPGKNLDDLVRLAGPLPPARVVHFLSQVCEALEEAHSVGFIHRDIKPANVFAAQRGGIWDFTKLLDFGVVREMKVDANFSNTINILAGTPSFMSPEQITNPTRIDARADLYAVGAVAYFLLTGRPPFLGNSPIEVMLAQVNRTVDKPSVYRAGIPSDLETIVMHCLENDVEKRISSAQRLRLELESCHCAGGWTKADAAAWWTLHGSL